MQVLVVLAHPTPGSLNHVIADRACSALRLAGHDVHLLDLYAEGFRAAMSPEESAAYQGDEPLRDPMTHAHAEWVRRSNAIVFVYPTWWSGQPAILKGWLERVLVPGVGFVFNAEGKVRPGMTHVRSMVGISTYGSPWRYVRVINDNGRRTLMRTIRLNTGRRTRTKWLALYAVDTAAAEEREAFLARVERTMRALG
ncbi:MAG: NAD(P)H-dependent oxidoreductase [Ilumatobacteraceae bacterium]